MSGKNNCVAKETENFRIKIYNVWLSDAGWLGKKKKEKSGVLKK